MTPNASMNQKGLTISLIVLVVILAGIFGYALLIKKPTTIPQSNLPIISNAAPNNTSLTESIAILQKTVDLKVCSKLEIKGAYPQISGLADSRAQEKINSEIAARAIETKLECSKISKPWDIDLSGEALVSSRFSTVSILEKVFVGSGELAHPYTEFIPLTYRLNGSPVELGSMFRGGSHYLERLAALADKALSQQFSNGANPIEPKAKNFKNFVIGDDGLHIQFDEYVVGSRAFFGAPKIIVPWRELDDLLIGSGK